MPSTPTGWSGTPTAGSTSRQRPLVGGASPRSSAAARSPGRGRRRAAAVRAGLRGRGAARRSRRRGWPATSARVRPVAGLGAGRGRTVKLAGATAAVQAHLREVDPAGSPRTSRENRVRRCSTACRRCSCRRGVVAAWAAYLAGSWGAGDRAARGDRGQRLRLVRHVMGAAVTEAPVARRWLQAAAEFAGTDDLVGAAARGRPGDRARTAARTRRRVPLRRLRLRASPPCTTTARSASRTSTSPSTAATSSCSPAASARASRACCAASPVWSTTRAGCCGTARR